MKESRIIVLLDGTRDSLSALSVAEGLARYTEIPLLAVHMDRRPTLTQKEAAELGWDEEATPGLLIPPGNDDFVEKLLEACSAYNIEFMVVNRNFGAAHKPKLSQITRDLLSKVDTPLVIVPWTGKRTGKWKLCRMLLPHDGTPVTAAGLGPSVRLLEHDSDATISVLHVGSLDQPRSKQAGAMEMPYYVDRPQYDWPAWADEFLERFRALGGGIPEDRVRLLVAIGNPGEMILERSKDLGSDLVILAWHGKQGTYRAQTLFDVISGSSAPIMVVRSPEGDDAHPRPFSYAHGNAQRSADHHPR